MTEFSKIELERKLAEAKKEIEYYKKIAEQTGNFYLRETEALSKNIRLRQQAEKELRESEERFKFLTEKMADIIWTVNLNFQTTYVSPSIEKILGFTPEERKRQTLEEMITPGSLEKVQMMFLEELRRDESGNEDPDRSVTIEVEYYRKDGSTVWLENKMKAIRAPDGTIVGLHGVSRDITERKQAKEALRESESKFRNLFDLSPQAIALTEIKSGKLVDVNLKFCELTKYSKEEILGLKTTEVGFYRESDRNKFLMELQASGRVDGLKMDFKAKDNTILHALMFAKIIHIAGVPFILTIFHDITEQKLLKAQLQRAEKMEAIGTLAGGVAHDLNNILSGIVGYPDLLLMQISEDSPLRTSILNIQDSGKKAAVIVQDLLTLARRGVDVAEVVNLNDIILEYLKSPEHEKLKLYHPGVEIETNIEADLLNISGSSVHLSKIVLNLVSNAAEAMPDGGKIFISAENRYLDRPISGYDSVEKGDYVTLRVSDTGIGISKIDLERIFEPFYTKKVMGRSGTGLGMAVIWGTVKDHKGYIDVQSTEGKGSTFTLYFPATREKITREECILDVKDYMGKGESILVIDDVKGQREFVTTLLTALGYSTHAVSSGEEAVEYLKERSVDLIVLDMIMDPGMDGLDTYKEIIKFHPRQKAIIVSGFSETNRVKEAQILGAGAYVKKPYTLEKIGISVRDELKK